LLNYEKHKGEPLIHQMKDLQVTEGVHQMFHQQYEFLIKVLNY